MITLNSNVHITVCKLINHFIMVTLKYLQLLPNCHSCSISITVIMASLYEHNYDNDVIISIRVLCDSYDVILTISVLQL